MQSTALVETDLWYHVAGVKRNNRIEIYVNGHLEQAKDLTELINDTDSANLLIGGNAQYGAHLNGLIDEVEIYNRALNGAEIQAIFNAGVAGKCKVNLATSVPAMTEWGLVLMSLFFGGSGFYLLRRRRTV